MTENRIRSLANSFRKKIDQAQNRGLFVNTVLKDFPVQCCGVASKLLAEFLGDKGIETLWINGEEFGTYETHAWLIVKDDRIDSPRCCLDDIPDDIMGLLEEYGGGSSRSFKKVTCYDGRSIKKGLIIDITGDQFGEPPVYVGYMDNFHRRFDFLSAYEHERLSDREYIELYELIVSQ